MNIDVLCIGHTAYDVSLFLDEYPQENSKHETHEANESGGGPAANAAFLLSSWGLRCAFAGVVGADAYGQRIHEEFIKAGTDVSLLERRSGHATPLSMILINRQNGSRTLVNRKVKTAPLQLPETLLHGPAPRLLMLDGHELEASLQALKAFPEAIAILDAGSWREGTAELTGRVRYLAASERFAKQATGFTSLHDEASRRDCLQQLRGRFPGTPSTIVTLGEHGLIYDAGEGFHHLPAFPVRAVDTTAAGDIFHGALAYAIGKSIPLHEGLRLASMAAALSVQKPGGRASTPTLQQVHEALAEAAS